MLIGRRGLFSRRTALELRFEELHRRRAFGIARRPRQGHLETASHPALGCRIALGQ